MPNNWQKRYAELTDFVAKNPTIEIEKHVVSIPKDLRPEFYKLFDRPRIELVEENFPDLINEARTLSENYIKTEQEAIKLLRLEGITLSTPDLRKFLEDPIGGMISRLFHSLFDLLKGRVDTETFEERALVDVEATYNSMYQSGYRMWVVLSLVEMLDADRAFRLFLQSLSPEEEVKLDANPASMESVPPPQESNRLSFEHKEVNLLTVPDFIIHSAKLNRYIALRSGLDQAVTKAPDASEKREWLPLDSMRALGPDLTLIYLADNPEEISLVADKYNICRPDIILACMTQKDWYEGEKLGKVKLHHSILKPRLGTFIVSRELVPEQADKEVEPEQVSDESTLVEERKSIPQKELGEQEPGIYMLTVGFDQSKLEPIIKTLMNEVPLDNSPKPGAVQ